MDRFLDLRFITHGVSDSIHLHSVLESVDSNKFMREFC
nr:MAG TPA: hypothetical protein [Caudoviricetes sp.]